MSLDLGSLVGFLEVDPTRWRRGIDEAVRDVDRFGDRIKPKAEAAGHKAGDAFGDGLVPEAERAGQEAGEKAGDGLLTKGRVAAAAAGTAFGMAFADALQLDASRDKLTAQLGANVHQSERYGRVAGRVYAGAWGDSMDQVNTAIASVVTSLDGLDHASGRRLERLTTRALDFATAFEVDVVRAVQVAGVVVDSKLAKSGLGAFDLLTKAAQKAGPAYTEDVLDAVEEYSTFFSTLGYTGPQAFALLVDASEKGVYGIDKAGDAIKEFTIRSTDGSKLSRDAYKLLGLDAEEMANKIVKGGDDAQEATQKVIDGLLDIEDPATRAQTAIALFGTPIEDLNVRDIPDFLRSLQGISDTMDDTRGATKRMSTELNDNAASRFTSFKRKVQTQFVTFFVDEVIPVLDDFAGWWDKTGGPALSEMADDVKPAAKAVGDMVDFFTKLPSEAKISGLVALFGGVAALKVRGGKSGLLASVGSAVGLAKPVPVIVTNPGWDVPGGKPGAGGASTAKGILGGLLANPLTWFATQAAVGTQWSNEHLGNTAGSDAAVSMAGPQSQGGGGGLGAPPGFFDFSNDDGSKDKDRTQGLRDFYTAGDIATQTARDLGIETDANVGKFEEFWRITGRTTGRVDVFQQSLDLLGQTDATPGIHLTGYEQAMSQIATLTSALATLPGPAGLAALPGLVSGLAGSQQGNGRNGGGNRRSPFDGATFHVQPPNYDAFMRDMDRRAQTAGLGGFN